MPNREYNGKNYKKNYRYNRLNNRLVENKKFSQENFKISPDCFNCPQLNNNSCSQCCPSSPSYPSIGGGNNCITPSNKWNFAKH